MSSKERCYPSLVVLNKEKAALARTLSLLLILMISVASRAEPSGLDCLLKPNKHVDVSSPVRGIIQTLYVSRGDLVKESAPLFDLRTEIEEAEVKVAEARAEFGERTVLRNEDLYQQELISVHERDEYATDARLAVLSLNEAIARLEQKRVTSPIDGYVVETSRSEGEYVDEQPVLTLVNIDPLYAEVVAPTSYLGKIEKGMKASVTPEAPMDVTHEAVVSIVDPIVDAASGTIRVRLEMPNPDRIPSGLKCSVEFDL